MLHSHRPICHTSTHMSFIGETRCVKWWCLFLNTQWTGIRESCKLQLPNNESSMCTLVFGDLRLTISLPFLLCVIELLQTLISSSKWESVLRWMKRILVAKEQMFRTVWNTQNRTGTKGWCFYVSVYGYFAGEYATFQAPQNPSSVLNDCSQKEERDSQEHNCSHGKSILLPYSFQQLFSFVQLSSQVLAPTDSLFLYIHNKLSMCCSLTIIKPNTTFCTIHLQSTNLQSTNQTLTN